MYSGHQDAFGSHSLSNSEDTSSANTSNSEDTSSNSGHVLLNPEDVSSNPGDGPSNSGGVLPKSEESSKDRSCCLWGTERDV